MSRREGILRASDRIRVATVVGLDTMSISYEYTAAFTVAANVPQLRVIRSGWIVPP
jgi:hypothetical protein